MTIEKTHSARDWLIAAGKKMPGIWAEIEKLRDSNEFALGVYMTDHVGVDAFLTIGHQIGGRNFLDHMGSLDPISVAAAISPFITLAAWRMTQGIYRFDPALYKDLIKTPLSGDLPADVLTRLPEWCVYLETPDLFVPQRATGELIPLIGAWVRLHEEQNGEKSLIIGLNILGNNGLVHQHLPLVGTLQSSVDRILRECGESDPAAAPTIIGYLTPILNLLLYLCAYDTEIRGRGQPGNPIPKKTKRGMRIFCADGPETWDVGVRIGAALRHAYHAAEMGDERIHAGLRPHIRRAHWHGFRSGPMKRIDGTDIPVEKRKFDLRWLPPIPVNLNDIDKLPATIHPVKP